MVLLSVINFYEAMVIGACAFIIRKHLDGNESAVLLLVGNTAIMDDRPQRIGVGMRCTNDRA